MTYMSNINFKTALFNQTRTGNDQLPQLTGFITVPVAQLDQFFALIRAQRTFDDQGVATVRIPLSFWTATGKAPLAYSGQSSFMATASVPAVDPTPTF